MKVNSGVSRFEGVTAKWFGWAERDRDGDGPVDPVDYRDGPFRLFKWRARLDARRLARALRKG